MQVTSSDCSSAVQHSFVFCRRHRALETLPAALQRGAVAHGGGRGQRQRCGTSPLPATAHPNQPPPPPAPVRPPSKRWTRGCASAAGRKSSVPLWPPCRSAASHLCYVAVACSTHTLQQAANEAHDSSAAASACRDAQQLLHSVHSEESFTMQVIRCCRRPLPARC